MTKIYYALVFAIGIFVACVPISSAQTIYTDPSNKYSFTLPDGWEEMPKAVLDQYSDAIAKLTSTKLTRYRSGFQLAENEYFVYPYILIQERYGKTPSYEELEKTFHSDAFRDGFQKGASGYSEIATGAVFEEPVFDKEKGFIFINTKANIESNSSDISTVYSLTGIFLGKREMLYLTFAVPADEYAKWQPVFDSIVDSFSFKEAYAYDPVEAAKKSSYFSDPIRAGFFGAFIGFIVLLIAKGSGLGKRVEAE